MSLNAELIISIAAAFAGLLLLIFAVDWRNFRDWIVVFLYTSVLDSLWGAAAVNTNHIEFPFRQFPQLYRMSLLFDFWIFPILCILYNQVTRERGLLAILFYAMLFSTGMTAIEYPLELYTDLLEYLNWNWFTSFCTLTITFLSSRAFMAFYRWGYGYFGQK